MPKFIDIPGELEPHQASKVLYDFLNWTWTFLREISDGSTDKYAHLFVPHQIKFLPRALMELTSTQIFDRVLMAVSKLDDQTIADHGLAGTQLAWKLSNVEYPYDQFETAPTAELLAWTLDALDALLESILDGIPGGPAIIELKKAIENSIDRTKLA